MTALIFVLVTEEYLLPDCCLPEHPVVPAPGLRVHSGQPLELGMVPLVGGGHLLKYTTYHWEQHTISLGASVRIGLVPMSKRQFTRKIEDCFWVVITSYNFGVSCDVYKY